MDEQAGTARPRRPPRVLGRRPPVIVALCGGLAVALVAVLTWALTPPRVIHAVASGDPGAPPAVPSGVDRVGWTWKPPPGVRVEHVAAGPHGPVLVLSDGVVALDGPSGEELWTYRDPRGWDAEVRLFEDVLLLTHDLGEGAVTATPLDPATGEITGGGRRLEGMAGYARSTTLHAYRDRDGAGGVRARVFDRTATGPGGTRWTFVPRGKGLFCEFQRDTWPTTDPGTGDGRVVVAHTCADAREYEERTLQPARPRAAADGSDILAHGGGLESAVATVTALDLASGAEVWRHEHPVRDSWARVDLGPVEGAALPEGAARALVLRADAELYLLDPRSGEPLGHPEEARDSQGRFGPRVERVLRADTGGTVIAVEGRYPGSGEPLEVLTSDPEGAVTARVTLDLDGPTPALLDLAVVLDDALLIPYADRENGQRGVHSFALAAGDLGGERVAVGPPANDVPGEHRLVAVPGAVVSYGTGAADVHGLVP